MTDVVEATFDVCLKDPLSTIFLCQQSEALFDRIRRGTSGAEPVGVQVARRFRDRFERKQVQRLHCPILCRRNPEWRSEEHTSELQSLMRISYAVLCLKKKQ